MSAPALFAMISYSQADAEAAELVHEELALRGLSVAHDRCTFPVGARIASAMRTAVADCDAFVGYLTPASLYEEKPEGPRPAIDEELLPAFDRLASSRPPVLIPLVHGLGDPRTEAVERVRAATGRDISSLWMPVTLDQSTPRIQPEEAAEVARLLVQALVQQHADRVQTVELSVVTRGSGQASAPLVVDATNLLGGDPPRVGDAVAWRRYLAGLRDLECALAAVVRDKSIRLIPKTHITGGFALGRVFHQAAGWVPSVMGRHGSASSRATERVDDLELHVDPGALGDDVSVEIDLLGVNVAALAAPALAVVTDRVSTRVVATRTARDDLTPAQVAGAADAVADRIRTVVHDRRPGLVHVFCAAPVELAVLVGTKLTSLHADLQLYEREGHRYVPTLRLPA